MAQPGHPIQASDIANATGISSSEATMIALGIVALVIAGTLMSGIFRRDSMAMRIRTMQERRAELRHLTTSTQTRRRKKNAGDSKSMGILNAIVGRLHLLKNSQIGQMQKQMNEAGLRSKDALTIYAFFNMALPIFFLFISLIIVPTMMFGTRQLYQFGFIVLMTYVGLKLPAIIVGKIRKKRLYKIQRSLADTLDLMTVCAEAGLSLGATLDRVSRELAISYPEMAQEIGLASVELGFLPERSRALLNLAERVPLEEVRGIASVLIQTEKYGTPVAQALRVLSNEFRTQRMLRAEDKAARLPALMTVPMIVFILPTMFVVMLAPAIIRIMDSL